MANRSSESDIRMREEAAFDLQEQVVELRKDLASSQFEAEQARAECIVLAERLSASEQKLEKLVDSHQQNQDSLQDRVWRTAELEKHAKDLISELGERMTEIADLTTRLASADQRSRLAETKLKASAVQMLELRRMLQYADLEYGCVLSASKEQQSELEHSNTELRSVRSLNASLQERLAAALTAKSEELLDSQDKAPDMQDRIAVLELTVTDTEDALRASEKRLAASQSESASMTEQLSAAVAARESLALQVKSFGLPANQLVCQLQDKIQELEGRVDRRDQTLLNVAREKEKLETNLALAQDTLDDLEVQLAAEQQRLASALDNAKANEAQLAEAAANCMQLESALPSERAVSSSRKAQLAINQDEICALVAELFRGGSAIRKYRSAFDRLRQRFDQTDIARQGQAEARSAVEAKLKEQSQLLLSAQMLLDKQIDEARQDAEATLTKLAEIGRQKQLLEQDLLISGEEIARLTAALEASEARLSKGTAEAEERERAARQQSREAQDAMQGLMQGLASAEAEQSHREEEVKLLSAQLVDLRSRDVQLVAEAEASQEAYVALQAEHATLVTLLQEARQAQQVEVSQELETATGELVALQSKYAAMAADLADQQAGHAKEIETATSDARDVLLAMKTASADKDSQLSELTTQSIELRGKINQLRSALSAAETEQQRALQTDAKQRETILKLEAALAVARGQLAGVTESVDELRQRRDASEAELSIALSQCSTLQAAVAVA